MGDPGCATADTRSSSGAPRTSVSQLRWTGTNQNHRPLVLRLVRGSARIVWRPGPIEIQFRTRSSAQDPRAVTFVVSDEDQRIAVSDHYPAGDPLEFRECLPPEDARGDFWHSDVVVDALIYAPAGLAVETQIMDPQPQGTAR